MAITQRRLVEVIREQCASVGERVPGYRSELESAIADVMVAEREHAARATAIQQQVTERLQSLGDVLWRKDEADALPAENAFPDEEAP